MFSTKMLPRFIVSSEILIHKSVIETNLLNSLLLMITGDIVGVCDSGSGQQCATGVVKYVSQKNIQIVLDDDADELDSLSDDTQLRLNKLANDVSLRYAVVHMIRDFQFYVNFNLFVSLIFLLLYRKVCISYLLQGYGLRNKPY